MLFDGDKLHRGESFVSRAAASREFEAYVLTWSILLLYVREKWSANAPSQNIRKSRVKLKDGYLNTRDKLERKNQNEGPVVYKKP